MFYSFSETYLTIQYTIMAKNFYHGIDFVVNSDTQQEKTVNPLIVFWWPPLKSNPKTDLSSATYISDESKSKP